MLLLPYRCRRASELCGVNTRHKRASKVRAVVQSLRVMRLGDREPRTNLK